MCAHMHVACANMWLWKTKCGADVTHSCSGQCFLIFILIIHETEQCLYLTVVKLKSLIMFQITE